jgi:HEPN domain-containing protein
VAELCHDAATIDPEFAGLAGEAAPLDKYYIPTRYPNGLPGGIPSEAFSRGDAEMALAMCAKVLDFVRQRLV